MEEVVLTLTTFQDGRRCHWKAALEFLNNEVININCDDEIHES